MTFRHAALTHTAFRHAAAIFAAAILAATVPAQQRTPTTLEQQAPRVFVLTPAQAAHLIQSPAAVLQMAGACPVSLQARQGMDGDLLRARHGAESPSDGASKSGQRIHVIVGPSATGQSVVSATVRISGLSARPRTMETFGEPQPDLWRTVTLGISPDGEPTASANLKLAGFTAIQYVRLQSVTFADGTTFTPPSHSGCTIQPDRLMRVVAN